MSKQNNFSDVLGKYHHIPYILCSAIHILDDVVYDSQPYNIESGFVVQGRRHSDYYSNLMILGYDLSNNYKDIQGFITSNNRFVDRTEAYEIALQSGQVKERETRFLISEDIY